MCDGDLRMRYSYEVADAGRVVIVVEADGHCAAFDADGGDLHPWGVVAPGRADGGPQHGGPVH